MTIEKKRKLKLSELEEIARPATRAALIGCVPLTKEEEKNLTLGSRITDTEVIFELYIAADSPTDARIITSARVDRITGEVTVEVFQPRM